MLRVLRGSEVPPSTGPDPKPAGGKKNWIFCLLLSEETTSSLLTHTLPQRVLREAARFHGNDCHCFMSCFVLVLFSDGPKFPRSHGSLAAVSVTGPFGKKPHGEEVKRSE